MSTSTASLEHPLLAAAREVGRVLDEVAGSEPMWLSTADKQALLVELTTSLNKLAGLRARTLATAGDVAAETGSRDPAAWLAVQTRTSRREAVRAERIGAGLARWTNVAQGVGDGSVTWEQAEVLVRALDALPDALGPEQVAAAEVHLVAQAAEFGPRELRILGRRVLEVIAP